MTERKAPPRRFPPPWQVRELEESFVIEDDTSQPLAYVYLLMTRSGKWCSSGSAGTKRAQDRREHRQAAGVAAPI